MGQRRPNLWRGEGKSERNRLEHGPLGSRWVAALGGYLSRNAKEGGRANGQRKEKYLVLVGFTLLFGGVAH